MVDWLVLLTPLAALPIALLFVFLGCALDSSGLPPPIVALTIDGNNFQADVESVKVEFQYTTLSGESPSNLFATETLMNADLVDGKTVDKSNQLNLYKQPEGWLVCTCIIKKMQPPHPSPKSESQFRGDPHDVWLVGLRLSRDGDSFNLEVPEIEYVGGL